MMFWLICGATALVVMGVLVLPLLRRDGATTGREADLSVYRDQLATLDAEVARGAVAQEEADATRIELSRRLIVAGAQTERRGAMVPVTLNRWAIGATILTVLLLGTGAYVLLGSPGQPDAPLAQRIAAAEAMREATPRPPQAFVEALHAAQSPAPELSERDADLIAQLAAVVAARPTDLEGRRLLARSYMQLGKYLEGKTIQAEVVALAGETASADDLAALAEFMIVAAGGYVSPEAEAVLERALSLAPDDPWARYYLSRARAQTGDVDAARSILAELAGDDATPAYLRDAARNDLTMLTGPDAQDIDAAAQLDAEAQREMVQGMVGGLAQRLNTEGGSPAEWARLIRSYDVLGQDADADAAHAKARAIFAQDPAALTILGERE